MYGVKLMSNQFDPGTLFIIRISDNYKTHLIINTEKALVLMMSLTEGIKRLKKCKHVCKQL